MTEEVYSDDVSLTIQAEIGEADVYGNIHVDLGTSSLYFGGISRSGLCRLGRLDYARDAVMARAVELGPLDGEMTLELRSRGEMIELRVWREGSERPEEPTLEMRDNAHRLGSIAVSTHSHPATLRRVHLQTTHP